MPVRTRSRAAAVGTLALVATVAAHGPAVASCGEAPDVLRLADHDSVFAGDVRRTTHGGGVAEVRVTDVWHGPDLPPQVVVVGGQLQRGASSSTDRHYEAPQRYAFYVTRGEDGVLRDDSCSATHVLRAPSPADPPGVRPPTAAADAVVDPRSRLQRTGLVLPLAALGALAAVAVVARRSAPGGSGTRSRGTADPT